MAQKKADGDQFLRPYVRVAPLGEINVFPVYEHELDELARGSPAALFLNFALFLLPIALTLFVTLLVTRIESGRVYYGFLCVGSITLISGTVLLALWWREHRSSKGLLERIKNRMPPPPGTQDQTAAGP